MIELAGTPGDVDGALALLTRLIEGLAGVETVKLSLPSVARTSSETLRLRWVELYADDPQSAIEQARGFIAQIPGGGQLEVQREAASPSAIP